MWWHDKLNDPTVREDMDAFARIVQPLREAAPNIHPFSEWGTAFLAGMPPDVYPVLQRVYIRWAVDRLSLSDQP